MAELYPYPRFSMAERDRRWQAVRELMRGAKSRRDCHAAKQWPFGRLSSQHTLSNPLRRRRAGYCRGFSAGRRGDCHRDFGGAALADGAGSGHRRARGAAQLRTRNCRALERIKDSSAGTSALPDSARSKARARRRGRSSTARENKSAELFRRPISSMRRRFSTKCGM